MSAKVPQAPGSRIAPHPPACRPGDFFSSGDRIGASLEGETMPEPAHDPV